MERNRINLMPNSTILANIIKASMEKKTVTISYKNVKGVLSERETEPYEVKGDKYWGYCLDKGGIRQFSLPNILEAKITNNKYSPRWDVKIN